MLSRSQVATGPTSSKFSNQFIFLKMERRGVQFSVSSKGEAVCENRASAVLERESIGVFNSGLMYEPMAETHHTSVSHMGYIMAAQFNTENSKLNLANEGIQAHLCDRAVKMPPGNTPPPPPPSAFPSIAFRGLPISKERNELGFGPPDGNCKMAPLGVTSHILQQSQAQSNKFDIQLPEMCQRRFVMFDDSGSKRRVIFHPAMMYSFSTLLPSSLQKPALLPLQKLESYYFNTFPDEAASRRDTMDRSPLSAWIAPSGASFPCYYPHLLPINRRKNSLSSALDNCDTPLLSMRKDVDAKIEEDLERTPEPCCYSHENTEDLEALLSSDEEDEVSSTGHSPSDLTRNNSPECSHSKSEGHSVCASKKRKRGVEVHIDDDTCSSATSGNKMCKETLCQTAKGVHIFSGYGKEGHASCKATTHFRDLGYGKEDLKMFDLFLSNEASSSSSRNNPKQATKVPCTQQQSDVQSRKEKIKNILRLLRGIIPGGESMETAFVLDEAIQYVRTLQFEVQKLQARKLT